MQHILLVATGTSGDVNPLLAIGAELRRRGHPVTLITHAPFEVPARAHGLNFCPLDTSEEFERGLRQADVWNWRKSFPLTADYMLRCMAPAYQHVLQRHLPRQTVLVFNGALGARIAQEKLNIPAATIQLAPCWLRTVYDTPMLAPIQFMPWWFGRAGKHAVMRMMDSVVVDRQLLPHVNAFRAEAGLPPIRRVWDWFNSPRCVIGLWPDWFGPTQPDWPPQTVLTGFLNWDGVFPKTATGYSQAGEPQDKPILFTFGTGNLHARDLFAPVPQICRLLGRGGIVLTRYADQLPSHPGPEVKHIDYAPFSQLLPQCAAIVHHGGIGTLSQALAAGIPQVIVPMVWDQFDNARRLKRLGVARSIARWRFAARPVSQCIRALLDSEEVAKHCRHWSTQVKPQEALRQVCDTVQSLNA